MLSIHVAQLTQAAQQRVDERVLGMRADHFGGCRSRAEDPDSMDIARGLSERGARHREASKDEVDDKDAPVHQSGMTTSPIRPMRHLGRGWLPGSLAECYWAH